MFKKTQHKFQLLNQQSEDVRTKAAIRIAIVVGAIIVPLVLVVILPIQLKVQSMRTEKKSSNVSSITNEARAVASQLKQLTNKQVNEGAPFNVPQVGGVSDINKQYIPAPNLPKLDISQEINNNQGSDFKPTPSPEELSNPNNIPVDITP